MYLKKTRTNRYLYHVSAKCFRKQIFENGLIGKPSSIHKNLKNPVFAHNRSIPDLIWYPFVMDISWDWIPFDNYRIITESKYDYLKYQCIGKGYDFWEIDTYKMNNVDWYIDFVAVDDFLDGLNYPYYVVTEGWIPPSVIRLYQFHEKNSLKVKNGVAHIEADFRAVS